MTKKHDYGQYPLRLHGNYRVIQGIGGLGAGDLVRVVGLRSELQREEARSIFVTFECAGGVRKEVRLDMGPCVAKTYFELIA